MRWRLRSSKSGSGTVTPSLVAARSTGIAPLYVHFDASGTTSTQTARPFHDIHYSWDFGESSGPGVANWGKGAALHSRNIDYGPIAGHIFETAGTYIVTLTATDGVSSASTTASIVVTAADSATEFLTTKTVCVNMAADSDFTGAPSGHTPVQTDSLQTAMASLTGTVKRIMFKRGGTWDSTADITKNLAGPIQICSYGSGALPKWRLTSGFTGGVAGNAVMYLGSQSQFVAGDFRIMDIEIDASLHTDPKNIWGFYCLGTMDQQLFLRITYRAMTMGLQFSDNILNINEASWPGQRVWSQLAVVDCLHPDPPNRTGQSAVGIPYGDFLSGEKYFYAGNDIDLDGDLGQSQDRASHCLRTPYSYKGIIAHNNLASPGNGRHHIKAHGPVWTETSLGAGDWTPGATDVTTTQGGGAGYTRYLLISDNKLTQDAANGGGWFISAQPQGSVPGNYSRNKDQIIERNWGIADAAYLALVVSQAEQCTIRNNISHMTAGTDMTGFINHLQSASAGWVSADCWIYNNSTFHNNGASGESSVVVGAGCTGTVVKNNLHYAPSDTTGSALSDAGTGTVASNNSSNIQTDPKFSGALTARAGWQITDGTSYTKNAGAAVPVWRDLFNNVRPNVTHDIGASEQ